MPDEVVRRGMSETKVPGSTKGGLLRSLCWCMAKPVELTASAVRSGQTTSCGASDCRPPR